MAFAELKRLKAKIRQGSATEGEREKYRNMTTDHHDHDYRGDVDEQLRSQQQQQQQGQEQQEQQRSRQPLPAAGLGVPDAKRQRMMVNTNPVVAVSVIDHVHKEEASKLVGMLRRNSSARSGPSSLQLHQHHPHHHDLSSSITASFILGVSNPEGSNSALLNALRASKATRGHHQQSKTMFSSVVADPSSKTNVEEAKARRLTGMQETAAILSQSAPVALSSATTLESSSKNTSTNMSAHHMLRRLGNPHRRVVHQMLREQHERILREMKRKAKEAVITTAAARAAATAASASGVKGGTESPTTTTNSTGNTNTGGVTVTVTPAVTPPGLNIEEQISMLQAQLRGKR
jgi:hypothetical protein